MNKQNTIFYRFYRIFFFIIILMTVPLLIQGQSIEEAEREMIQKLSKSGKAEIEKAKKLEAKADDLLGDAADKLSKINNPGSNRADRLEKKALKKQVKASELQEEAHKLKYKTYKTFLYSLRTKGSPLNVVRGMEFEKEAEYQYEEAKTKRKEGKKNHSQEEAYRYFMQAYDYETSAVENQVKAYITYMSPNDYLDENPDKLNGDDEIDGQVVFSNDGEATIENGDENKTTEKTVTDTETTTESVSESRNEYETTETDRQNDGTEYSSAETSPAKNVNVFFKVQIIATQKALSAAELRRIFKGDEIIHSEMEDGFYKYSVGRFKTYKEAEDYKKQRNLPPDAFIIAYKNNERIPVKEALELTNK